jgi:hypothetical protein
MVWVVTPIQIQSLLHREHIYIKKTNVVLPITAIIAVLALSFVTKPINILWEKYLSI